MLALPANVIVDCASSFADDLAGTVVVDTANEYPTRTSDTALAVRVQDAIPDSRVVKAFNTIGANRMRDPVVAGGLTDAGLLEDLARLWIHLSGRFGRDIAFRLLQE